MSTGWVIKTHKAWDKYTEQERDGGRKWENEKRRKEGRKKNREYERDVKKRKGSVKEQRGRQVR